MAEPVKEKTPGQLAGLIFFVCLAIGVGGYLLMTLLGWGMHELGRAMSTQQRLINVAIVVFCAIGAGFAINALYKRFNNKE